MFLFRRIHLYSFVGRRCTSFPMPYTLSCVFLFVSLFGLFSLFFPVLKSMNSILFGRLDVCALIFLWKCLFCIIPLDDLYKYGGIYTRDRCILKFLFANKKKLEYTCNFSNCIVFTVYFHSNCLFNRQIQGSFWCQKMRKENGRQ